MKQKRTYPDPIINLAEVSRYLTGKRNTINAAFIPKEYRVKVMELDVFIKKWRETMELKGKVIDVLPSQSGTNKEGKPWSKREFVLETGGEYSKRVCLTVWGDNPCPEVGDQITATISLASRKFGERWYTEATALHFFKAEEPNEELPF